MVGPVRSLAATDPRTGMPPGTLPPSWSDARHVPGPGMVCACCGDSRFSLAGGGYCCDVCHPPAANCGPRRANR